ncbi:MAG: hypothetical protein Q8K85_16000, partial [Hyphomicrobium sp.]|nr:hypothetical protein [Hyphomicrobium sp.]
APESLTQGSCGFVHGDIWQACGSALPDRVSDFRFIELFSFQLLTPWRIRNGALSQGRTLRGVALLRFGVG